MEGGVSKSTPAIRADFAAKSKIQKMDAEERLTTKSGFVQQGMLPGYKGHVPRHRDHVGTSAYEDRPLRKLAVQSKRVYGQPDWYKPSVPKQRRPQSARGPKPGEIVQVM